MIANRLKPLEFGKIEKLGNKPKFFLRRIEGLNSEDGWYHSV
jgi:hypothetical protein